MNVLGLCGSLRANSLCAALLRATRSLAPAGLDFHIYEGLGHLPLFNPDLESEPPPSVVRLWAAVGAADAIVIASPEYAHGVTGTIKNTLDWLVGHIPFAGKPVAVFNPSDRARHADAALKETLRTMAADLIPDACVGVPVIGSGLDQRAIETSAEFSSTIAAALQAIVAHVRLRQNQPSAAPSNSADPIIVDVGDIPEIEAFLAARIYEFNSNATGYFDGESFSATQRDDAGTIRAGIYGYTWGGCGYVSYLWVDERHRGHGLGRALLRAAEEHARTRDCAVLFVATHSFQAPDFYERMGFERQTIVRDHPLGHSSAVYAKRLKH
jgi:NAD(P)H-dependent FMN reductase/N-acetylglutamate synthase-like GNAT family acetyltransferase